MPETEFAPLVGRSGGRRPVRSGAVPTRLARTEVLRHLTRVAGLELRLRWRRPGLPVALLALVVLTALYLPPADAGYLTLSVQGQRAAYSPQWTGLVTAVLGALAFSLAGFFLLTGPSARDAEAGTWAALTAAPLPRAALLGARTLAQTLYLWGLWSVVMLGSVPVMYARAEQPGPDLVALLLPSLLLTFPVLALVAGLSTLTDTLMPQARLGRAAASVLLWTGLVLLSLGGCASTPDLLGVRAPLEAVTAAFSGAPAAEAGPGGLLGTHLSVGVTTRTGPLVLRPWAGLVWTPAEVLARLLPVLLAILAVLAAAALDPQGRRARPRPLRRPALRDARSWRLPRTGGGRLVVLEARAAWVASPRWLPWLAGALWLAGLGGQPAVLPLLVVVGLPVAARLVFQGRQAQVRPLLSTTWAAPALPRWRVLGAALTLLLPASGAVLTLAFRHPALAAALVVTCLLGAALLLTLDTLGVRATGAESLLFLAWYLGPFNHLGVLDALNPEHWPAVLALAVVLTGLSLALPSLRVYRLRPRQEVST